MLKLRVRSEGHGAEPDGEQKRAGAEREMQSRGPGGKAAQHKGARRGSRVPQPGGVGSSDPIAM